AAHAQARLHGARAPQREGHHGGRFQLVLSVTPVARPLRLGADTEEHMIGAAITRKAKREGAPVSEAKPIREDADQVVAARRRSVEAEILPAGKGVVPEQIQPEARTEPEVEERDRRKTGFVLRAEE